jgi:hypothetical protein
MQAVDITGENVCGDLQNCAMMAARNPLIAKDAGRAFWRPRRRHT